MNEILKELMNKYKGCQFCVEIDKYFNVILFNDERLKNNEEFIEYAYSLADKYLSEEDNLKFTLSFDYLGHIKTESCEVLEENKLKIKDIKVENVEKILKNEKASSNIKLKFEFQHLSKLKKVEKMEILDMYKLIQPKYSLIESIKSTLKRTVNNFISPYLVVSQLSSFKKFIPCKTDKNIIKN